MFWRPERGGWSRGGEEATASFHSPRPAILLGVPLHVRSTEHSPRTLFWIHRRISVGPTNKLPSHSSVGFRGTLWDQGWADIAVPCLFVDFACQSSTSPTRTFSHTSRPSPHHKFGILLWQSDLPRRKWRGSSSPMKIPRTSGILPPKGKHARPSNNDPLKSTLLPNRGQSRITATMRLIAKRPVKSLFTTSSKVCETSTRFLKGYLGVLIGPKEIWRYVQPFQLIIERSI